MIRLSKQEVKKRWYLFSAGLVLLCLASYYLAFSKTIELYSKYKEVNQQKITSSLNSKKISISREEIKLADKIIERFSEDTLLVKEKLLDKFSGLGAEFNCKITSISKTELYDEYGLRIIHNEVELEGSYFGLLKILNELENSKSIGKINSCELYVVKDFMNKVTKLRMKLFIQNIDKNDDV